MVRHIIYATGQLSNDVYNNRKTKVMNMLKTLSAAALAAGMALLCTSAFAQQTMGSGRIPYTPQEQKALDQYATMTQSSIKLSNAGDAAYKHGDWKQAQNDYQQAAETWPDNSMALYGLGDLEQKVGNTAAAIVYYRSAIYNHFTQAGPPIQPTVREWNADRLMKYVLLLSQAGQETEALTVYHHAVNLIDYEDGRQRIKVMLPDFGPGGLTYTPQRLQAMAHIGVSMNDDSDQDELSHLQQSALLAPDVPVTHFFLGRYLVGLRLPNAREELELARQGGGAAIGAEADRFEKTLLKP